MGSTTQVVAATVGRAAKKNGVSAAAPTPSCEPRSNQIKELTG